MIGLGGPFHHSGEHVQGAAQADHQAAPGLRAVFCHPKLLLRRAEADEAYVGGAGTDVLHHGSVLGKVAVAGAANDQSRVGVLQMGGGQLGHAGLCAQKEQALALRSHPAQQALGKIDPGHLALQRAAQDLGRIDHADAVGQHQIGIQQRLAERRVRSGLQQEFRVRGHSVMKAAALHQRGPGAGRLVQRQVVKPDAQYVSAQGNMPPHQQIIPVWNL